MLKRRSYGIEKIEKYLVLLGGVQLQVVKVDEIRFLENWADECSQFFFTKIESSISEYLSCKKQKKFTN